MRKTVKVIVSGNVQGVGFRAWACRQAEKTEIHGWVRNLRDGTVEALFSGDEESVNEIIAKCKEGPPAALVNAVTVSFSEEKPEPGFRQKPTA